MPASVKDFLDYLSESQSRPEKPYRYLHHIRGLLDRMVQNGLLVDMGVGGDGSFVMLPRSYYALSELSNPRAEGVLWLAKTLGGRFVHRHVSPAVVHIVGENNDGEGSGIVFDEHHVLTCRHVVSDMQVASTQALQGRTVTVEDVFQHGTEDVAVIRIRESLETVPGLVHGCVSPTGGTATLTSVRAKSDPLNSKGSPVISASA